MSVMITHDEHLNGLVMDVDALVDEFDDEYELTRQIAGRLRDRLAAGMRLPESVTRASEEKYVMYPLYVDPSGRFSIASAVWNIGQGTPVHGHETWGVVGIYSGIEHELSFEKPEQAGVPIAQVSDTNWKTGEVTVCCTTDDDVHQVFCGSEIPCIGIHVYGADIGTLRRRSYDVDTGEVSWFVSHWTQPAS